MSNGMQLAPGIENEAFRYRKGKSFNVTESARIKCIRPWMYSLAKFKLEQIGKKMKPWKTVLSIWFPQTFGYHIHVGFEKNWFVNLHLRRKF